MSNVERWRGLLSLVTDAVDKGSTAIEGVQMATARRPFAILESIEPIAAPVKIIHAAHDLGVAGVHGTIRLVNRGVAAAIDRALSW